MLQRNGQWTYPDIDPVHDKVMGRTMLARSAVQDGRLDDAVRHYGDIFEVHGFNGTSPWYADIRAEHEAFLASLPAADNLDVA